MEPDAHEWIEWEMFVLGFPEELSSQTQAQPFNSHNTPLNSEITKSHIKWGKIFDINVK